MKNNIKKVNFPSTWGKDKFAWTKKEEITRLFQSIEMSFGCLMGEEVKVKKEKYFP